MLAQTLLALGLTLVSACLINWGYLTEHGAASALAPLSVRAPLRSLRLLLASRRWLVGFGAETGGFALYFAAVALAPLALVQAVAAGGIGVLASLVARTTGTPLDMRERFGVTVAIGGLALLGVSLAGGSEPGSTAGWIPIAVWLGASIATAALAVSSGATVLRDGAAFGVAAGILFAAGDVSTKVMVDSAQAAVTPAVIGFYAAGTIVADGFPARARADDRRHRDPRDERDPDRRCDDPVRGAASRWAARRGPGRRVRGRRCRCRRPRAATHRERAGIGDAEMESRPDRAAEGGKEE